MCIYAPDTHVQEGTNVRTCKCIGIRVHTMYMYVYVETFSCYLLYVYIFLLLTVQCSYAYYDLTAQPDLFSYMKVTTQ